MDHEPQHEVVVRPRTMPSVIVDRRYEYNRDVWNALAKQVQCHVCRAGFPNPHLLDLHISEVHDCFFQAQVARGDEVYQCLVEYCPERFQTVEERSNHLIQCHKFTPGLGLETMHIKRKSGHKKSHVLSTGGNDDDVVTSSSVILQVEDDLAGLSLQKSQHRQKSVAFGQRQSRKGRTIR